MTDVGRTIGKYRVLGILGRGSMGVVYKAEDPEIGRVVAIKTLRPIGSGGFDSEAAFKRFCIEARSAGNLRHPNIVTIFEVSRDGDLPFMVMDYLEGRGLDGVLKEEGLLDPRLSIKYLAQIAHALDYAHSMGVIHRDIKPSNILIDRAGAAFVLDFGVAMISGLKAPDTVLGTPGYMSPEQILNADIDYRSDLFSLAVVAFECFAGRRPFVGDDLTTVVGNILNARPLSLTEVVPELPLLLEAELTRALERRREERFNSAREMISAFAAALSLEPPFPSMSTVDPAARGPRRTRTGRSSSGWKRVRQRKISDLSVNLPQIAGDKDGASSHPWATASKGVDEFSSVKGVGADGSGRGGGVGAGGLTLFGEHAMAGGGGSKAGAPHYRPFEFLTPATVLLGLMGTLSLGAGVYLVMNPRGLTGGGAESPPAATVVPVGVDSPLDLPDATTLEAPEVLPIPLDRSVEEMEDKELLGVIVLGASSDEMMIDALYEAFKRRTPGLLEACVFAFRSDSYLVRIEAIKVAAELSDRRIVPELLTLLDDRDPLVRGQSAKALGSLGDARAVSYLTSRFLSEESDEVRTVMKRAIERVNGFPFTEPSR